MFPGNLRSPDTTIICILILLLTGGIPLAAQTTGMLEGLVFDPSGRVIPGASIEVIHQEMGTSRHLTTDTRGRYQALNLLPGSYSIEVSHPGLRGEIRQSVEVSAGRVAQADFRLKLGEPQERIVVNAEIPLLSTRTSDWGGSTAPQKLENLPLIGRDLFDLSVQTPGVAFTSNAKVEMNYGSGIHIAVNGNRPNQNSFRLDGVYINDATSSAPSSAAGALLGIEGVSELRIVSSPFSAEYGRAAGAVITAVSKSGSNDWHGSAYEFLRNSALDAKNFFDPGEEKIPPLRRNQFGGSLGGPILASKLFVFGNYEGIRSTAGKTERSNTLTEDARKGLLPTSEGALEISVAPEVKPYLALYPLPNGTDFGDGTAEYLSEILTSRREDLFTARIDYNVSERLRLFGRYTFDDSELSTSDPFKIWTFPSDSRYQFFQSDGQYMPSPNTIHSLRFAFSRVRNAETSSVRDDIPESLSFVPGQSLGAIDVTGLTSLGDLRARLSPKQFALNSYQFSYDGTVILGSHILRFGGSIDRIQFNQRADNNPIGRYRFSSVADFLEANPRDGNMMYPGSETIRGWRQLQFAGFFQDEFRLLPNLSATLGLRYEAYTTPTEVNGKIATIPDPVNDTEVTVGGPLFVNPSAENFAPRAAISWDPFGSGNTVVRAGAGIFFDLLGTRELIVAGARMPPFYVRASAKNPSFPDLLEAIEAEDPSIEPDTIDFQPHQPYTIQYQLSIEQKIPGNMVVRGSYAGTRGVHLPGQIGNVNPPVPTVLDDGRLFFPEDAPRINPAFDRIYMRRMEFNSFFHALHAELQRRWNDRWSFQAKYTWSKSIDESSSAIFSDFVSSDQMPMIFDYRLNRGLSDFDTRHLFGLNLSHRLPEWDSGIQKHLLGGWEIHGLMQAKTGHPFSPIIGYDHARINPGSHDLGQRPDLSSAWSGDIILGNPAKYFNDLAFDLPTAGTYGNLGRNTITGPDCLAIDMAFHKDIWNTDRHNVRFRMEVFNIPNRPNFQIPSELDLFNSRGGRVASAGRITSTSTPSRQIQFAVKWTF